MAEQVEHAPQVAHADPTSTALLPRSTPAASGVSSRAISALLDRLDAAWGKRDSLMIVHRGRVIAEGWWAPYTADRPHLLYSLTKSFTSIAVGIAIGDGVLSLDDRVVDVLPEHVPADPAEVSAQARRITVHHLLSMTAGIAEDSLVTAWELEPSDLVKGFLRMPFAYPEGTRHTYDNATTFILARMVEKATGRSLPDFLDARLFHPMGIRHAEWDRVAGGLAFGFHGLHLTTEAVAAFGQLLLDGGRFGGRQLVPADWVERATRRHVASEWVLNGTNQDDFARGYGYQFWMARHGYGGQGAYGQQCVVVPSHDLVIAATAEGEAQHLFDALWDCLLPGLGHPDSPEDDAALAARLRALALPIPEGTADPDRTSAVRLDASADSALPEGTAVTVEPADDANGWTIRFDGLFDVPVGHGTWRESAPLGRPVAAAGAWRDGAFTADIHLVTTPHRVRLTVRPDTRTATLVWSALPLTGPDLMLHLTSPLMTRPDVS